MHSFRQRFAVVLMILIILSALFGVGFIIYTVDRQVVAALIAAIVAFNVPVVANFLQRKRELDFKTRDKKVDAYQKIFDFLGFFLKSMKQPDSLNEFELVEKFYDINHALIAWGSPAVTMRWAEFYQWISSQDITGISPEESVSRALIARTRLADLVKAIRSDLGHGRSDESTQLIADLMWPLGFDPTPFQPNGG